MKLSQLLSSQARRRVRSESHRLRARRRLLIESMEDRRLLTTIYWDGGSTGSGTQWEDAENWVGDFVPGASDDVVIGDEFASSTIVINGNTAVANIASKAALLVAGTLATGGATFNNSLWVAPGGVLATGPATVEGTGVILNQGSIHASGSSFLVGLSNDGTFEVLGDNAWINGSLWTTPSSVIRISANDTQTSNTLTVANELFNNGLIELTSNSSYGYSSRLHVQSGQLTNAATGTILSLVGTSWRTYHRCRRLELRCGDCPSVRHDREHSVLGRPG